ncbi:hypothetical protein [Pseudotabrizicola algicola]|uniref:Uncharacterized protein n=1 Tax=Pseudotabrizicola algicola TaxID=2709381 RepID=A0A6B3RKK7_9RHOB|nr:hypothetical protein [Pseudotabrizicola algicola]NEX46564.1 hypothetical protein [Pseudotabrizicola algicola]
MTIRLDIIPPTPGAVDLFAALDGCERPWIAELSAKAIGGRLRRGRFLLSMPRLALGPGPSRVLRGICARLGAPPEGIAMIDAHQSAAHSVHFGFEPEGSGQTVMKCYLEFDVASQPAPDMVFLALKWRREDPAHWSMSHYLTRDALPPAARRALVAEALPDAAAQDAFLALMADSAPLSDTLTLLEVLEPGSPRRSFDLNLSDRALTLGAAAPALLALMGGAAGAEGYLRIHAEDRLGHIAAGVARDGQPFATVYHGAHQLWPEGQGR